MVEDQRSRELQNSREEGEFYVERGDRKRHGNGICIRKESKSRPVTGGMYEKSIKVSKGTRCHLETGLRWE